MGLNCACASVIIGASRNMREVRRARALRSTPTKVDVDCETKHDKVPFAYRLNFIPKIALPIAFTSSCRYQNERLIGSKISLARTSNVSISPP